MKRRDFITLLGGAAAPLGALPELLVFVCRRCGHVDTQAQERAA